jgi:hydrogenase small subunit
MRIRRRDFLKYCIGSAAALGLPLSVVGNLKDALAEGGANLPRVIWLNGANCTGCTISLANLFSDQGPADLADLLINYIELAFHPNLMGAAGDLAVQKLNEVALGDYILAIEGGIPTAFDGHTCLLWTENGNEVTAVEAVQRLAPKAAAILSIGTCASFGGIPAGNPNPTGIVSVSELIGKPTINLPGCPTHPDWIIWTVASLLGGVVPQLDSNGRPDALFNSSDHNIHMNCPRRGGQKATTFGESLLCLKDLGCKGPRSQSDCPSRKWNNGTNWCIGANAICIGCTGSEFPDGLSPLYSIEYAYQDYAKPGSDDPPKDDDEHGDDDEHEDDDEHDGHDHDDHDDEDKDDRNRRDKKPNRPRPEKQKSYMRW